MIEYEISLHPELSAIKSSIGDIYHLKGLYRLHTNEGVMLPVNRSYSPDINGDRRGVQYPTMYRKNRLIHEEATFTSQVQVSELLVNVYRKPLLFLQDNQQSIWYSSYFESNDSVSHTSEQLATNIKNQLLKAGLSGNYKIGIFGSHQPGLNSVDSDMDLIAWVSSSNKPEFLSIINRILISSGYKSSKETGKDAEYATHYSRKFNIPILAGWYLANKRMRWISPNGVSTSLQCINSDYDHDPARNFLKGIDQNWESNEITSKCQILSAVDSYNFPKVWEVALDKEKFKVLSFYWAHQGMGDDSNQFGEKYLFKGVKIANNQGNFLYLRDNNDYILPTSLL